MLVVLWRAAAACWGA